MTRFNRCLGGFSSFLQPIRPKRRCPPTPKRRNLLGLELRTALFQPLEERIMLDIGGANSLPPAIVVGRTLSAYDVPDVKNHQETITLTVYNESGGSLSGVLLTDTLASGVTFANASQLPDQNGQELAWSLDTIQPYERASVTLTVSLTAPTPTTLDTGASAYGTLDAGMVTWTTAPATLRSSAIAADLLASTPDANTTDPYIQEEAAQLNYDPTQIFNYLHNDVGYQSYLGSVRGARGTRWSGSGNALDVASLGVALMRASGIPAQYVSGTLSQSQAQPLILSMFPASLQTFGNVPAGAQTSDPANDPRLLSETESHYWLQFDAGSGMKDADPLMAGATIGQSFTAATGTFSQVADNLREKTEVSLTAEIYNAASAAFSLSGGFSDTVVLDQTFNDVDLVGHPLTIADLVQTTALPGLTVSSTTYTYTPYLEVGDDAFPDPNQDPTITGTPYQEVFSSLGLDNQALTGLFLNVTLSGLEGPSQTYQKTLFDRVGYVVRQNGGMGSLSLDATTAPAISPLQVWSVNVLPGLENPTVATSDEESLKQVYDAAGEAAAANDSALAAGDLEKVLAGQTDAYLASLAAASDQSTQEFAQAGLVTAYFDRPRLTVISASLAGGPSGSAKLSLEADLLSDSVLVLGYPGQAAAMLPVFREARGIAENVVETTAFPTSAGNSSLRVEPGISATTVFEAAAAQGIPLVGISATDPGALDQLAIDPLAKARIATALQSGLSVIVPVQDVTVEGAQTNAWYEFNPVTGETVDELENGAHGLFGAAVAFGVLGAVVVGAIGIVSYIGGTDAANVEWSGLQTFWPVIAGATKSQQEDIVKYYSDIFNKKNPLNPAAQAGFKLAFSQHLLQYVHSHAPGVDPPLDPFLLGVPAQQSGASQTTASLTIEPASGAAGAVQGTVAAEGLDAAGNLQASWKSDSTSGFLASSLSASAATVTSAGGAVGLGQVTLATSSTLPVSIQTTGAGQYAVVGSGSLSFYGPAENSLGVSGEWSQYSANVSGNLAIAVTVPDRALTLNGEPLPAGTYTIVTSSATLAGSGTSTSPNFSGSASITLTNGTVDLGAATGSISITGNPLDVASGATLAAFSGPVTVTTGGNNTDNITLNGRAGNVLTVAASPAALTTDQNHPVTFQTNINTSFADTYNLTAQAPPGWTVTIDDTGKVSVTPAPGTQGGSYPIQIVAQSTASPDLVAQTTVGVTITPTQPGITFNVNPDPTFSIPFDGAQVPSAFQAQIDNTGPAADAYHLTFSNVPAGFTVLDSGTSVTVPAGQTGILGIYLQPTDPQLPPPGTQVSFTVTATSTTNPAITQTQTVSFTIPEIDAVTASVSPASVSTTPGNLATTTVTLNNVGNAAQNIAAQVTTPAGLTSGSLGVGGLMGIGQLSSAPLQLTPAAGTPLNTTLTATVSYASQPAQDVVSVLQVTPNPAAIEMGQSVDVSAMTFDGVGNPRGALALYTVTDSKGNTVFTSTAVPVQLTAIADTENIDLGPLKTTLTAGTYSINVSITEQNGAPIAGATGRGTLVVHSPVTADLSLDNNVQAPGNSTATDTLTINNNSQLGSLATDGIGESVAVLGNLAYVAGTQDISVVDVTEPANPQLVTTFGSSDLVQGGNNLVQISGNNLLVASQDTSGASAGFNLLVYSLTNPRSPTLVGSTPVGYRLVQDLFANGSTALLTTGGINYHQNGNVTDQFGTLVSVDLSTPAAPAVAGVLSNSEGPPNGGTSNEHGVVAVSNSLAYVLGSTSTGGTPAMGTGVVQVVNYSNPASLSVVNTLNIPGAVQALAIAVEGNQAIVVGSSGGWTSPFAAPAEIGLSGNVTVTVLDISDPTNPKIVGSTVMTDASFPAGQSTGMVTAISLGGGQYAVGDVNEGGLPVLLIVDASKPTSVAVSTLDVSNDVEGMAVSGDELLAASADGLTVYRIAALFPQQVTAEVTVPTTGGVAIDPSTFSLAPTQIINGTNSETLQWSLNLAAGSTQSITWQTDLTGLTADEVLPVVTAATIQDGGSTYGLPAVNVAVEPTIQTLQIPVEVVAPGADAIANASFAATQLGNTALSSRLSDLGTAVDNLVENVTSEIFKSQVQGDVTAVAGLLSADAFANSFAPTLTTDGTAVVQATTASTVQTALTTLGSDLSSLAQTLLDEAAYGFTVQLVPNAATILPGAPTDFEIALRNVGTQSSTYTLNYFGPGQGVFKQNGQTITSVTLQPGEEVFGGTNGITLEVTDSVPSTPVDFEVQIIADQSATSLNSFVQGTLNVPTSFVSVPSVDASPAFVAPGSSNTLVDVTAQVLNSVNETESALASYTLTDGGGSVVFTSKPVSLALTIGTSLATVDLGSFDTSKLKLAEGSYTITVTVTDTSGKAIPGGTGQGSVLVGTPLTANLSVSPTVVAPGASTVTDTLALQAQTTLPDPLTLDGQVQTKPTGTSVALYSDANNDLAYVAGTNGIDIVDISNPAKPIDDGTFGTTDIAQGGLTVDRIDAISGTTYLIVGSTVLNSTGNVAPFNLLIYSLAKPLSPTLVSNTQFSNSFNGSAYNNGFLSDMVVEGNTVLIPSSAFYSFGGVFEAQFGNVVSIDVSNPKAPTLEGVLFPGTNNADSQTNQFGATIVNSQIAYIASTTTTGGNTQNGVGRVLVVDYSDPTNMKVLGEVDIPNTYQVVDVAVEGNVALVVGSAGGNGGPGINGTMTLSVLDISTPGSPKLIGSTLFTNVAFPTSGAVSKISALPIGNNQFAISEGSVGSKNVLLLADVTDPSNIVVTTDTVPALANEMAVADGLLYTTSSSGLLIYKIGTIASLPFTASVEVPNNANLSVVSGSFNIPPTQTVTGTNFTTYSWTQSLAFGEAAPTFTWQTNILKMTPGQSLQVAGPGSVAFTSQGTKGTIDLPPQFVSSDEEMSLSPATETVQPGAPATYTITLENPYPNEDTYGLSVVGVPANWVSLNTSPTVPASGSLQVTLTLTSDEFTPDGTYDFTVLASDGVGYVSTAQATLILAGAPASPPDPNAHGVVVTLNPETLSAGQGSSADYTVQLTNTGSADETYKLTDSLPTGVTGSFSQSTIDVPPGASNFRDVTLTLTPQAGATAGNDKFNVTATSTANSSVTSTADGTLTVVAGGVSVALTPASAAPGSPFSLKVTNTGKSSDTFNLALAGSAALVSKLNSSQVTLNAGASTTVPIATSIVDFADAGTLSLTGTATSAANSSVRNQATANLTIASTQSMTAAFSPSKQTLAQPGATSFLLQVNNTGNSQDSYSATIVGTTGSITASLIGLDGQPAQSVPLFILPGLSTGAILLDVSGAAAGTGTVKVLVQSLTTGSIQTTATATLTVSAMPGKLSLAANLGLSLAEGSSATIGQSTLDTTDSDPAVSPADIVYTLAAGPAHGSLTLAGQTLSKGGTFTQDDIDRGRLAFRATAEGADSFLFSVAAGGLTGPSATFVVAVSDPAVVATGGFTFKATEGSTAASQDLATFTDPGGAEAPANYAATIDWGDGSSSAGSIAFDAATGTFTVNGQHNYSEEGTYTIAVTEHHGSAPDTTATSTARVSDPAVMATGGFKFMATEGSTAASQTVATFTDPGGAEARANYSATINWGDGNSSAGSIAFDAATGTFTVSGQHAYSEEGTYTIAVTEHHESAPNQTTTSTAIVSDPAVMATGEFTFTATEGSTAASQTVATFTDPGGAEAIANYAATIDWGDGKSSAGAISLDASTGAFTVSGQHSYSEEGTYTIAVTEHHGSAPDTTTTSTANVAAATITQQSDIVATGVAFQGYEFSPATAVTVATFSDGTGALPASDFNATVDWGDGTSSSGTVSTSSSGYIVSGSHEYVDEGRYAASVTIQHTAGTTNSGGTSATVGATATVHEQLLEDGTVGSPNQNYIQEIYRDLFVRQAEPSGLSHWTAMLDAGQSRQDVAYDMVQLAFPEEFQRDTVTALYEQYLGRAPDPAGMQYWTAYLYGGGTLEEMSQALVGSQEYLQVRGGGTAAGFVTALFHDVLGRPATATDLTYFEGLMANGMTPADVADVIFSSDEYRRVRVNALFEQFLDRPADSGSLAYFTNELAAGTTDETIISQLISSNEYFDRVQI